jgi:hypothetical protein
MLSNRSNPPNFLRQLISIIWEHFITILLIYSKRTAIWLRCLPDVNFKFFLFSAKEEDTYTLAINT